jgi:hypothetical protein
LLKRLGGYEGKNLERKLKLFLKASFQKEGLAAFFKWQRIFLSWP